MKKSLFIFGLLISGFVGAAQTAEPCPCGTATAQSPVSYSFNIVPGSGAPQGGGATDCCKGIVIPGSSGLIVHYTIVNGKPVANGTFTTTTGAQAQRDCCGQAA